ncbi:hypothetical protein GGF32_003837 [Allomyces javanicus]|nr:hypothetical protein GGF32_003837 [Allomyces javanicus]
MAYAAELNAAEVNAIGCMEDVEERPRPVTVVRFVARDTVEGELATKRTGVPVTSMEVVLLDGGDEDGARAEGGVEGEGGM